jgi:hypothetical protein
VSGVSSVSSVACFPCLGICNWMSYSDDLQDVILKLCCKKVRGGFKLSCCLSDVQWGWDARSVTSSGVPGIQEHSPPNTFPSCPRGTPSLLLSRFPRDHMSTTQQCKCAGFSVRGWYSWSIRKSACNRCVLFGCPQPSLSVECHC